MTIANKSLIDYMGDLHLMAYVVAAIMNTFYKEFFLFASLISLNTAEIFLS
jgi:hypothetical protein